MYLTLTEMNKRICALTIKKYYKSNQMDNLIANEVVKSILYLVSAITSLSLLGK